MNLIISERNIFSKFVIRSLKSHSFNKIDCRLIHSKNCFERNVIKNNPFLSTRRPNLCLKREINFARIRKYYRILRLKDRGVTENLKKDRVDPKSNFLVYKAEVNRICTLGGVLFPGLTIIACIAYRIYLLYFETPMSIDPHYTPKFIDKYIYETLIIISILHISLSKRYVLRMYLNREKKTFCISTWRWYLPFRTHTFECKPGSAVDSRLLNNNFLIETMFGNTKIGNKRYFINEDHFTFPVFYNVLFGFSPLEELNQFGLDSGDNHNQIAEQVIKQRAKESL